MGRGKSARTLERQTFKTSRLLEGVEGKARYRLAHALNGRELHRAIAARHGIPEDTTAGLRGTRSLGPCLHTLGHNRETIRELLGRLAQRCFEPLSDFDVHRVLWNTVPVVEKQFLHMR